MGTRAADIHVIADRCRKVGWTVTQPKSVGGGYRIKCKDGFVYNLHASYSDTNAIHQVVRVLDEHGLAEAEKKIRAQRSAESKKRNAAERLQAEAAGAKLAREATLVQRAAGPYADAEHVPLDWFIKEHPAPWMRWVIITPALAKSLLEYNSDNRPWKAATVAGYRRIIGAGGWRRTHQGMAMDTRPVLQDGQQRLMACIEADKAIEVAFFVGMPPDNFKSIDEGRNRSIGDLLGKDGEIDVNLLGTTVRLVAAAHEPFPRTFLKNKTPNAMLYDEFHGDPDALRDAVRWGRNRSSEARMVGSALAAARYLLCRVNGTDNDYVNAFLNGLVTGVKGDSRLLLDADDPRTLLRAQLQKRRETNQRTAAVEQLGLILWAWNNVASGRRARHVRWADFQNDVPAITKCLATGPRASAVPELLHGEFQAGFQ